MSEYGWVTTLDHLPDWVRERLQNGHFLSEDPWISGRLLRDDPVPDECPDCWRALPIDFNKRRVQIWCDSWTWLSHDVLRPFADPVEYLRSLKKAPVSARKRRSTL